MAPLSLDNPAVQSYIVYSAILALKVLAMATFTALTRITKGVFANPEDASLFNGKVKFGDLTVERVRRAHLNDLENITAFWILGALYLSTGPVAAWATLLFRVFAGFRVLHTVFYLLPLRQPSRAIAYGIPYLIMFYMGAQIITHYITAI